MRDFLTETKFGPLSAWVASLPYPGFTPAPSDCEAAQLTTHAFRVDTPNYLYFSALFRPPDPAPATLVTCACPRSTGECEPTARWQTATSTVRGLMGEGRSAATDETSSADVHGLRGATSSRHESGFTPLRGAGFALNGSALVGVDNDVLITNHDSSLIFESHVAGRALYPWPQFCSAQCGSLASTPDCLRPLIQNGCPTSPALNFKVLSISAWGDTSVPANLGGRIVFSLRPFAFGGAASGGAAITVRCQMVVFETSPALEDICGNSHRDLSQSGESDEWVSMPNYQYLDKNISQQAIRASAARARDSESFHGSKRRGLRRQEKMHEKVTGIYDTRRLGSEWPSFSGFRSFYGKNVIQQQFEESNEQAHLAFAEFTERATTREPLESFERAGQSIEGATFTAPRFGYQRNDRFIQSARNEIVYDDWAAKWGRDSNSRRTEVQVGNADGFVGSSIDLKNRASLTKVGWSDSVLSVGQDTVAQSTGVGFAKGDYGVNVQRGNLHRSTGVEAAARHVESATIVDLTDRDYGQRVKVRDFELSVRHDFNEFVKPTLRSVATEVALFYRTVGVAVGTDVGDQRYGVTVGVRGYQVSAERDFDGRETRFQGNWGGPRGVQGLRR